jgi:predicted Fe-Mo cluster-binding NifX family protein
MDRPKMRSAGIFDARLLANEHAEVVVVTNIAAPVF